MNDLVQIIDRMAGEISRHADGFVTLSVQVTDLQRGLLAMAQALTNQPNVDRPLLAQDVAVALRLSGTNLDSPSPLIETLLTSVRTPHEVTPKMPLGEKLLRTSALRSDPESPER